MPLDHDQTTPGPRPWWLGGAVVAVGALWLYGAVQLPIDATHARIGPGMFVAIVGGALVLLGLALTVQIARGTRFEPQDAEDAVAGQAPSRKALLTALLGAALPLYTMERFGFVEGVGAAPPEKPRFNYTGDPYETDGLRAVLWLTAQPVSYHRVATQWPPPQGPVPGPRLAPGSPPP